MHQACFMCHFNPPTPPPTPTQEAHEHAPTTLPTPSLLLLLLLPCLSLGCRPPFPRQDGAARTLGDDAVGVGGWVGGWVGWEGGLGVRFEWVGGLGELCWVGGWVGGWVGRVVAFHSVRRLI